MSEVYQVTEIYIYPIKSLAGISLNQAKTEEMGFENDRRWMLINSENVHVTQREYPIMSQFYPQISDGKIKIAFESENHEFSMDEFLEIQ
ncbi:MOSC N-terminal beta barrel domain-containing protein [Flavobacterium procerum]|uniref:MOSC N-terminal beta barrel domain-containing protein n=1 Tax=Flavobacterium procerum TaxID=1455569 RepID=UPI0035E98C2B